MSATQLLLSKLSVANESALLSLRTDKLKKKMREEFEHNYYGASYCNSSTCCGAVELTEIDDEDDGKVLKNAVRGIAESIVDRHGGGEAVARQIVYYGIKQNVKDVLESLGFKLFTEFYNVGSSNWVYGLQLTLVHENDPPKPATYQGYSVDEEFFA